MYCLKLLILEAYSLKSIQSEELGKLLSALVNLG